MIRLTRLNDDAFALNAELIRYVEERPDTIITLTTGDRLTVRESMDEVIRRTVEYHRSKCFLPTPTHSVRPEQVWNSCATKPSSENNDAAHDAVGVKPQTSSAQ